MIVVDASVLVTALADDSGQGAAVRHRLEAERLGAPELIDLEVVSVFRRLWAGQKLGPERAAQAIEDLAALRLERMSHRLLLARCWGLRDNLSVYDAAYVALAEILETTLLTADRRLARAPGISCAVEVLG